MGYHHCTNIQATAPCISLTRAPLGFAPTSPGAETQTWSLHASTSDVGGGHLVDGKYGQCLNVVSFTGPDVGLDPCKEFGANDSNEMFAFQAIPGSTATTAAIDAAAAGDADVVVAGALRGRRAPAAPEAARVAASKLAMIRSYTTNVDGEQCKNDASAIFVFIFPTTLNFGHILLSCRIFQNRSTNHRVKHAPLFHATFVQLTYCTAVHSRARAHVHAHTHTCTLAYRSRCKLREERWLHLHNSNS